MADPFELIRDSDGTRHAIGDAFSVTVLPDKADTCEVFWRNRIKPFAQPAIRERILVAQLDDVRLYVKGDQLIMTKKNYS